MARKALLTALALILALAVPAFAQQKGGDKKAAASGASSSAASAAPRATVSNFGQRWNGMTDKERELYLEGMAFAFRTVCMSAVMTLDSAKTSPQEADKTFRECFSSWFPYRPYEVKQAMTAIYQDKANNIIPFDIAYGQALLKVKGDSIEDNLTKLRQDLARQAK
ncbi:hypothetical protein [Fundidesulfovibrio agrisoli]|uniref:hypothetical protein n=1 Tax=Fundidesulfovibrio agrisoli TaxID=2922717 RepID=UPI001FAE3A18|nr:hypothetical protein [Fundidesulfovibrio agrisoli]